MASSKTISAAEACDFEFPESQFKSYGTTEFILHSRVAEVLGDQLGRVFYDEGSDSWLIEPSQLRGMALNNILQEGGGHDSTSSSTLYSRYPIYGSAIAFDPGVWTKNDDLEEGVTFPAASVACLNDTSYCTSEAAKVRDELQLTELKRNIDGQTVYSPFAFRGPPHESVYENCSRDQRQFCPSMDLAHAYNYTNVTVDGNEWFTAPRCLYLRDEIRSGYWTSPYFDAGAGQINMVTYSQPIISESGTFLGVATIDITVDALCYGDQCNTPVDYNYLANIRPVGFSFFAIAMASSLACGVWTQIHKKNQVVIASQPFFLRLICMGCLVMSSSIIPFSIDDSLASPTGCSKACMAFPWLLSVGFATTFSALFSKIWRVNRVFHNASRFRRETVKVQDALWPFAILMSANCVLMIAWTLVDPLIWFRAEQNDSYESMGYCRSEGKSYIVFLTLIAIVNISALVLANIQAFRARNISTEFSESLYVMMTMISLLQAIFIGVPLLVIVRENNVARYFVSIGLIFIITMATIGLMFVPKMILVRQRARGDGGESSGPRNGTRHPIQTTQPSSPSVNQQPPSPSVNQNITNRHLSKGEQAPQIVIDANQTGVGSGSHSRSVVTGTF